MPTEDVSDLRDVVDAINKLCETMKTSYDYDDPADPETEDPPAETEAPEPEERTDEVESWSEPTLPADVAAEMYYSAIAEASLDMWNESIADVGPTAPATTSDTFYAASSVMETKSEDFNYEVPCTEVESGSELAEVDSGPSRPPIEIESGPLKETEQIERSLPKGSSIDHAETVSTTSEDRRTEAQATERCEAEAAAYETASELYYTASSEVSLLSDTELAERVADDSDKEKSDRNIMAGHVAAMRERFESMTRANTPCPDLVRSLSPSGDVFRNVTPSPDFLDKS